MEAYDLDQTVDSKLANISTRGLVQTGDDVMIGGIIILGRMRRKCSCARLVLRCLSRERWQIQRLSYTTRTGL